MIVLNFLKTKFLATLITLAANFGLAAGVAPATYSNLVLGMTDQNSKQGKLSPVAPANWGAPGVNALVEKKAVSIQFDCAQGEIRQPLLIDKKGIFKMDGFYKRGTFGPIRLGHEPKFEPAHYEGRVAGKVMKLKITLTVTNEVIGEFTLEQGKSGRLHRCL